jgi:CTP synthase
LRRFSKYTGAADSYLSVIKSLRHACIACDVPRLQWVEAGQLENAEEAGYDEAWTKLKGVHWVIVPSGFGQRGWR